MATRRATRKKAVLHGSDAFAIRPDYDATVAQLGEAPVFTDAEFEFVWPDTASGEPVGKFIYVPASEFDKVVAQLSGDYTAIPLPEGGAE